MIKWILVLQSLFALNDEPCSRHWNALTVFDIIFQQKNNKNVVSRYSDLLVFNNGINELPEHVVKGRCALLDKIRMTHFQTLAKAFVIEMKMSTDPIKDRALVLDVTDSSNICLYVYEKFLHTWKMQKVLRNISGLSYGNAFANIRVDERLGVNLKAITITAFRDGEACWSRYIPPATLNNDCWVAELFNQYHQSN